MNLVPANSPRLLRGTAHLLLAVACAGTLLAVAEDPPPAAISDFSGLYTFVREGESVQITLEQQPSKDKPEVPVTGYVSRLGDTDTDKDQVLDIWFKSGSTNGDRIQFATKTIHGISYEFDGHVRRGSAKEKGKEGYFEIEGTLTEHRPGKDGKPTARERQLTMKSFPDLDE